MVKHCSCFQSWRTCGQHVGVGADGEALKEAARFNSSAIRQVALLQENRRFAVHVRTELGLRLLKRPQVRTESRAPEARTDVRGVI